MKTCNRCKQSKALECFGLRPKSRAADGRAYECVVCHRERNKEYAHRCKDKVNARRQAWAAKNRSRTRAYGLNWVSRNLEKSRRLNREWIKSHPEQVRAISAKRRASKLKATPPWLTAENIEQIKQFYAGCPKGFEVDHIVPLQGDEVRGLHVPWNLQYLPKVENRRKGNKLLPNAPGAAA